MIFFTIYYKEHFPPDPSNHLSFIIYVKYFRTQLKKLFSLMVVWTGIVWSELTPGSSYDQNFLSRAAYYIKGGYSVPYMSGGYAEADSGNVRC